MVVVSIFRIMVCVSQHWRGIRPSLVWEWEEEENWVVLSQRRQVSGDEKYKQGREKAPELYQQLRLILQVVLMESGTSIPS